MPEMTTNLDEALKFFCDNLVTPKWDALMDLLAEDAVMEFPYHLPGFPEKLRGKREIVPYFDLLKDRITINEVRLVTTHKTDDPNVVILEAVGKGHAVQTGHNYEPKYITVLTFRNGLIVHWKDYLNPFTVLIALGGTIALPMAEA